MAPYCAIPRDYLSDTPLLRAMGFLVSQHGQLGAIPPPPFWVFTPWRACEVEVRYPPPQKGYLSDTGAIPLENKANECDTPLCDTISKGYYAIWGGISDWAAKNKGLPLPLGRGVCETKSKNGRARPWKPFISRVFCAQRGIETMVSDHGLGRGQTVG